VLGNINDRGNRPRLIGELAEPSFAKKMGGVVGGGGGLRGHRLPVPLPKRRGEESFVAQAKKRKGAARPSL